MIKTSSENFLQKCLEWFFYKIFRTFFFRISISFFSKIPFGKPPRNIIEYLLLNSSVISKWIGLKISSGILYHGFFHTHLQRFFQNLFRNFSFRKIFQNIVFRILPWFPSRILSKYLRKMVGKPTIWKNSFGKSCINSSELPPQIVSENAPGIFFQSSIHEVDSGN